jgi:low affinity Fe/Cu permease
MTTALPVLGREKFFDKLADKVSYGMGRPKNIIVWLIATIAWTVLFAFGGSHIASGTWLPAWFTSQGFNFPLNLVTTVAELFIGFLVGAAANRTEAASDLQMATLKKETDDIDAVLRQNTELTIEVHQMARLLAKATGAVRDPATGEWVVASPGT